MNPNDYKKLITQRKVLSFGTLQTTLEILQKVAKKNLADKLSLLLQNNKIDKPILHNKQEDILTTYYFIDLSQEDIEEVVEILLGLEANSVNPNGEGNTLTSFYASLVDQWGSLKEIS